MTIHHDGSGGTPARFNHASFVAYLMQRREEAEAVIERLIQALDEADPDPDLEPNHGAPCIASEDECEGLNEDGGDVQDEPHDPEPNEPSLGSVNAIDQTGWTRGGSDDCEQGDEREPDEADFEDCCRVYPRNGDEVREHVVHPVARRERVPETERPSDMARNLRRQLNAMRDERRGVTSFPSRTRSVLEPDCPTLPMLPVAGWVS